MRGRKNKRQHNDSAAEQRSRVVLSGHSTGSPNTEMEAMSHQVSIDAGKVPHYDINQPSPIDTKLSDKRLNGKSRSSENSDESEDQSGGFPYGKAALWSSVGLVTGALGYLAYKYYGEKNPTV